MLKFTLHFEDGDAFEGNSLNGSWNKAPTKPVAKLSYLFNNKQFVFEGFREYNHLVENVVTLQKTKRDNIFIMGRQQKQTAILWFNIPTGKVIRVLTPIGQEVCYIQNGQPVFRPGILSGWKEGIEDKPKIYLG